MVQAPPLQCSAKKPYRWAINDRPYKSCIAVGATIGRPQTNCIVDSFGFVLPCHSILRITNGREAKISLPVFSARMKHIFP